MKGSLLWRILLVLAVFVVAVIYVLPSFPSVQNSFLADILPKDKVNLGLDLQGGMHLTLGVDVDKAVANSLSQDADDLRTMARDENIVMLRPVTMPGDRLQFVLVKPENQADMDKLLSSRFRQYEVENVRTVDQGRLQYTLKLSPAQRTEISRLAMEQVLKTIRSRIDQFGVTEPDIRPQQDYRIQIQLPGLTDRERAVNIISKTAHLEFKLVDSSVTPEDIAAGRIPPGSEVKPMVVRNPDGTTTEEPIVVKRDVAMTGTYISDARMAFDQFGQPYVSMNFNRRGAELFERITAENVNQRLAIVLDGKVYSAPNIREKIAGGAASISGQFTDAEAGDLALVLRAGALPAPVLVLEEREVGPSLGQESIDQGMVAALIGGLAVVVFMAAYYAFCGLVADVVLALNVLIIMAALALFGATLTLPGIAGIILTIGMAVDANVLIFERIRENLRIKLTPKAAIAEGFSRATLTIVDSNVTTLIATVILYQFGTGPIRGFAVTLSIGIIASMFTAIFVSRVILDIRTKLRPHSPLSI